MTSDTMKVQWDQPLEVVYNNGDVFVPDESHGNYASWIDGDGDRRRHFFESDGRSNVNDSFRIRNKPAAAVAPEPKQEWGPAIRNDGFPAWLILGEHVQYQASAGNQWFDLQWGWGWDSVGPFYRLPANHPHYRTEKTAEAPLGVLTGVERLERLEAFVRRLAKGYHAPFERDDNYTATDALKEARAIVAILPPLIDPDLLKAREIVAGMYEAGDNVSAEHRAEWAGYCRDGAYDDELAVRAALAALRTPASDHRSK